MLCSSLAFQPPKELAATLRVVEEAGVTVVSLPLVNQWTQDRSHEGGRTPRWRGITLLHELRAVSRMIQSINLNVHGEPAEVSWDWAGVGRKGPRLRGSSAEGDATGKGGHALCWRGMHAVAAQEPQGCLACMHVPTCFGSCRLQPCAQAGIPTAISSDNVRDQFYAYGDLDMLEVFTQVRLRALVAARLMRLLCCGFCVACCVACFHLWRVAGSIARARSATASAWRAAEPC